MKSTNRSNIELQRLRQVALSIGQVADTVNRRCIGLSTEDVRIVSALHSHPESTATEIAKLTLLTPVQVGRRVSRLKAAGYIAAKVDCLDARAVLLCLSVEGRRVYEKTKTITENIQAWAIRDITDDEWSAFSSTLDKLLASVNSDEQENNVCRLIKQINP